MSKKHRTKKLGNGKVRMEEDFHFAVVITKDGFGTPRASRHEQYKDEEDLQNRLKPLDEVLRKYTRTYTSHR